MPLPIVVIVLLGLLSSACATCVTNVFLSPAQRASNALKNRTTMPAAADFDPRVTLDALLTSGDDRDRWSEWRAAAIEGYVVRVHDAGVESANCFSPMRRDAHIEIARRPDAPPQERLIVEITPVLRERAERQGLDWSTPSVARQFTGRRVRVEGWLFFDREHAAEAENTNPRNRSNWRATAWEIHPVTAISVAEPAHQSRPLRQIEAPFIATSASAAGNGAAPFFIAAQKLRSNGDKFALRE